jgi:hypothetical protein
MFLGLLLDPLSKVSLRYPTLLQTRLWPLQTVLVQTSHAHLKP